MSILVDKNTRVIARVSLAFHSEQAITCGTKAGGIAAAVKGKE